mmetsp:Transcript_9157/g.24097  ORF Transcript_9157/g.24097 Transcript_9157/m.24097 type:complete len:375 (+) Transcript_9157:909-2033(+)
MPSPTKFAAPDKPAAFSGARTFRRASEVDCSTMMSKAGTKANERMRVYATAAEKPGVDRGTIAPRPAGPSGEQAAAVNNPPTTNAATQAAPDAVLAFVSSPVANALETAPVVTMPKNVHRKAALSQAAQAGPRTASSAVGRDAPTAAVSTNDSKGDASHTSNNGSVKPANSLATEFSDSSLVTQGGLGSVTPRYSSTSTSCGTVTWRRSPAWAPSGTVMSMVTFGCFTDSLVWKPNLYQSPFFLLRAILICSLAFSACSSAERFRTASSSSSGIGGIVVVASVGGPWLLPLSSRRGGASASKGPSGAVSTTSGATVGGNNCFLSLTTAWRPVTGVLGAGGGVSAPTPSAKATTKAARAINTFLGARDRRARSFC